MFLKSNWVLSKKGCTSLRPEQILIEGLLLALGTESENGTLVWFLMTLIPVVGENGVDPVV